MARKSLKIKMTNGRGEEVSFFGVEGSTRFRDRLLDSILFLSETGGKIVYSEKEKRAGGLRIVKVWNSC